MADSSTNPPTKKRTRCATTLHQFMSRRPQGYRFPIEFNAVTKQPFGEFATKFKSYVAMLARNKASILAETWEKVNGDVKTLIWDDILQTFDIPNDEKLKNYWISYAGERWTQFKSTLTRVYVFGSGDKQGNTTPCEKYPYISTEIWALFVKSRMEEKFQSKRERAKEVQSKNNFYHTTSRGGYPMVKDKWKKNYVEARREESGDPDLIIEAPSPPRHELFKLAHQNKLGSFTTDKSASVASKIDELVEHATQGTFVPQGRQDILTVAIGKPDHFGRVRAAGRGVGLSIYFGPASRTSSTNSEKFATMKQELRDELKEELRQELRGELREEFKKYKDLKQDLNDQFIDPPNDHISLKNTIGSKASCSPSHVEEPLKNDWLRELYIASYDMTGHIKFDLDHEPQEHFYIGSKEIVDMVKGHDLELSHLGIWCTYLHRECIAREISHVYGLLDPYKVCGNVGYKPETMQAYIQKKLIDQNKTCFLAPYLIDKHWQLFVICTTSNTVVWMCSLHNPPSVELVEIVNNAMNVYYREKGLRKPKPQWVTPKVAKQNDSVSCGYYVMINMLTIVSGTITNNWKKKGDFSSFGFHRLEITSRVEQKSGGSVSPGKWQRNKYVGVSLVGKTLAVMGFGKVGSEVARRAKGLGMHVISHDPYAPADRARALGVELVSFDEAIATADFISLHMPLTPATSKVLNDETFAKMKKGVRIVNVARGGVIDEDALIRALDSGIVAQAALDVFTVEPPTKDNKLVLHEQVTATPHLGASTMEAQEGVAIEIAEAVVGALKGELAATAVNAPMVPSEVLTELKPFVDVAEKLGRLAVQLVAGGSGVKTVKVTYASSRGPDDLDTRLLRAMITKGLIEPISSVFVNLVNADFTAKQRGIRITEEKVILDGSAENPLEYIRVQIANVESRFGSAISDSGEITVEGRVKDGIPHLTKVGSFEVDVSLEGSIILCRQVDQPGMIGKVGSILGQENVNVSFMSVGRIAPRKQAVMAIGVDDQPRKETLKKIGDIPAVEELVFLKL